MGRINGANSDYKFSNGKVIEQQTNPLYLKIYICPNGEKNPLEASDQLCVGTDEHCPGQASGHAMIHLHKELGVEIMAGENNRILVNQNGDIELGKENGAAKITIKNDGEVIIDASLVTINGAVTIDGDITANNL